MVNEIIALSLGLTAGTFFFLAATFPALTIPLISIAVTGVSTLFVFAILKVINTLQAIPAMVDDLRGDLNDQIDEKYEDLKATTVDIIEDLKNTSVETINELTTKASTDFQKIATDTCNQTMGIVQQKLNHLDLTSRKLLVGGHVRQLCLTDAEIIDPTKADFAISASTTTGLAAKTGSALGVVGAILGTYFMNSAEIGGSIGATVGTGLGASAGGAYGALTNRYAAHSKAFVRQIDTQTLHCLFLNDQEEIQETTIEINFLEEGQALTQALLKTHEAFILEHITLSVIQHTNNLTSPYAKPQNAEPQPEPEMDILEVLAKKPIIFGNQSKGKEKNKASNDSSSAKKPRKKKVKVEG